MERRLTWTSTRTLEVRRLRRRRQTCRRFVGRLGPTILLPRFLFLPWRWPLSPPRRFPILVRFVCYNCRLAVIHDTFLKPHEWILHFCWFMNPISGSLFSSLKPWNIVVNEYVPFNFFRSMQMVCARNAMAASRAHPGPRCSSPQVFARKMNEVCLQLAPVHSTGKLYQVGLPLPQFPIIPAKTFFFFFFFNIYFWGIVFLTCKNLNANQKFFFFVMFHREFSWKAKFFKLSSVRFFKASF